MKKEIVVFLLAGVGLLSAQGGTIYSRNPHFSSGTWWTNVTAVAEVSYGPAWQDEKYPTADKDYILNQTKGWRWTGSDWVQVDSIRLGGCWDEAVFPGGSFQIGEIGGAAPRILIDSVSTVATAFENDGLILANGILTTQVDQSPHTANIKGRVTVAAPADKPFRIEPDMNDQTWRFAGPLYGAEGTALLFAQTEDTTKPMTSFCWFHAADASGFLGDLVIGYAGYPEYCGKTSFVFGENARIGGRLVFNGGVSKIGFESHTTSFEAGTVVMRGKQHLVVSNNGGLGNGTNPEYPINVNAKLTAYNDFILEEHARITVGVTNLEGLNREAEFAAGEAELKFLTVPSWSTVSVSDFTPEYQPDGIGAPWTTHDIICTSNRLASTRTYILRRRAYGFMENADVFYHSACVAGSARDDTFAFYGKDFEADYISRGDSALTFSTPEVRADGKTALTNAIYGAKSLQLQAPTGFANDLLIRSKTLQVDDLRLLGPCKIYLPNAESTWGDDVLLTGRLGVWNNEADAGFQVTVGGARPNLEIASDIRGTGDLTVSAQSTGKAGVLTLSGDNATWPGTIDVTGNADVGVTVRLASRTALGCGPTNFAANAVQLNAYATLQASVDGINLGEARRGFTVYDSSAIAVDEGCVFTVGGDITYYGALTKKGAGTLVLTGLPSADSTTLNLTVAEGSLRPALTNCLTGVTLNTEGDGAISFQVPDPTTEDFTGISKFGIVDPKLADNATLNVLVEFETRPAKEVLVPIVTVADGKAKTFLNAIKLLRSSVGVKTELVSSTENKRTTISVKATPSQGLLMIFN